MIETDAKALRTIISALKHQIDTYQEYENDDELSSEELMDIKDSKLYTTYVLDIVEEDYRKLVETDRSEEQSTEYGFRPHNGPLPQGQGAPH